MEGHSREDRSVSCPQARHTGWVGGGGRGLTSLLHFIRDDAADEVGTSTHQGGHQLIKLLLWS